MIPLIENLSPELIDKWQKQFVNQGRDYSEGIWRRTQEQSTKKYSGWQNNNDARRRLLHYYDEYKIIDYNNKPTLAITNSYLWIAVSMPNKEMDVYLQKILTTLINYGWRRTSQNKFEGPLYFDYKIWDNHPEDISANRKLPPGYNTLEITFRSNTSFAPDTHSPWSILNSGIRKKGSRTTSPKILNDYRKLLHFSPFQFELGGGASIDLGIPPLNTLHKIYHVIDDTNDQFVLDNKDTLAIEIIKDYKSFYKRASSVYVRSLLAEPNEFYKLLAKLYQNNLAVGEIITNNFDGMTSVVGLKEKYIRKYEDTDIIPNIAFHPKARSLIVVGVHADRRLVQQSARLKGLKVIFIDPEKYTDYNGISYKYPLENIEDTDLLMHKTAVTFAIELSRYLEY